MKKKSILLLLPFAAMALAGCGDKPAPDPCESAVVVLNKQAITLGVGDSETLLASMSVEGCTLGDVAWSSDHPEIAKVEDGKVTGVSVGTATITANGATCTVTVTQSGPAVVHVTGMNLITPDSKNITLTVGDRVDLNVEIVPDNATNKLLDISSDHPEIAKAEDGDIVAVAKGDAVITVASQDNPEANVKVYVHVSEPAKPTPEVTFNGYTLLKSGEVQSGEAVVFSGIDGDKYLTMGVHAGKNNIPAVESSVDSDNKLVLASTAGVYIAIKNSDGSFSFKDQNDKYLSAAGGAKNNYLKTVDEIDDTAKFSMTVTDGVAVVVSTNESIVSNTIALNASNSSGPIFSCYKPASAKNYPAINIYHGTAESGVTGVAFEKESYEVMVDSTVTAKASVVPLTATDKAITYSLKDLNPAGCATVSTVDNQAVINGLAEGSGTLVATTHEGSFTAEVSLQIRPKGSIVIPVTGISMSPKSATLSVGETKQIVASTLPDDATSKLISYESLNPEFATVSDTGMISAVAAGTAKIKVYATDYPDVTETFTVTVNEATVSYPAETSDGRTLIQSGSLHDGATINIVSGDKGKLVSAAAQASGTMFAVIDCSIVSEKLVLGEGSGVFTVVANKDGTYSFKTAAGKYLAANKDNNQLFEAADIAANSKFNVTIVNGAATIVSADPENTAHNTMMYNTSNPRFACYGPTSTFPLPRIYSVDPTPVDAEGIELDVTEKNIELEEEFTIEATVLPSWSKDKTVTWSTEGKGFVSCVNGLVKGLAAGTEIVTATDVMGHTATCTVNVVSEIKHVESIELNASSLSLNIDDLDNSLSATVLPADAFNKNFAWSSDNESVVKVDQTGKLECVGVGTANITVTTEDGGKTDSCFVSVAAASDGVVHAYEAAMALEPGQTTEREYTISGRIMFKPGNNLIVQDGDHAIIVYKDSSSTKAMEVGKKVSMRCKVQNYNGACETEKIKNAAVTVSDDEVTVNKATVDSSTAMDTVGLPAYADFKNLVLKADPNVVSGSNASIKVAFTDDTTKEYTLFVKSDLYSEAVANALNELKTGDKIEVQGAYSNGHTSGRQICVGPDSIVLDKNVYTPESVVVKNGEDAIKSLSLVVGGNATLTASVLPAKASQEVVWTTEENDGVISLENGAVGALKAGTATIVVTTADTTKSERIVVTVSAEEVPVTSVTLDEESVDLYLDETKQLTATVLPETATDRTLSWSVTEGSDVVSVSDSGLVTPLKVGTATVKVENLKSGLSDTCSFTVSEKVIDVSKVDKVVLNVASLALDKYADGSNDDYAWKQLCKSTNGAIQGNSSKSSEIHDKYRFSRDIKYVKITTSSKDACTAANTANLIFGAALNPTENPITLGGGTDVAYPLNELAKSYVIPAPTGTRAFSFVFTKGALYFDSIEIGFVDYVAPAVESVTLDQTELAMNVGDDDVKLVPTILPADAEPKSAVWASDKETVATVANGVVHAVGEGTANITYTVDGKVATCAVTVSASKTMTSIAITGSLTNDTYGVGEKYSLDGLTVTATYTDTTTEVLDASKYTLTADKTDTAITDTSITVTAHLLNEGAGIIDATKVCDVHVFVKSSIINDKKTGKTFVSTDPNTLEIDGIEMATSGLKTGSGDAQDKNYGYFMMNKGYIASTSAKEGYYIAKVVVTYTSGTAVKGKVAIGITAESNSALLTDGTTPEKSGTLVLTNDDQTKRYFNVSETSGNNTQVASIVIYWAPIAA